MLVVISVALRTCYSKACNTYGTVRFWENVTMMSDQTEFDLCCYYLLCRVWLWDGLMERGRRWGMEASGESLGPVVRDVLGVHVCVLWRNSLRFLRQKIGAYSSGVSTTVRSVVDRYFWHMTMWLVELLSSLPSWLWLANLWVAICGIWPSEMDSTVDHWAFAYIVNVWW